ncbi:MAG: methyl-accepting chemotaxis protein [Desulfovibrio sp.]|nr:methyl-accepting chemotaxis protein [Desulfovibrio sp.]
MRVNISKKIVGLTIAGVLVSCLAALCINAALMRNVFERQGADNLRTMKGVVDRTREDKSAELFRQAALLTSLPEFASAVKTGDSGRVRELAKTAWTAFRVDAVTVSDVRGVVLARGHSDKRGDDIRHRNSVVSALGGEMKAGVMYDKNALVPFSLRASAPVVVDGAVVGVVELAVSIGTEDYVDALKRIIGMEVTVFHGDTRVMTSIRGTDGKRIIGTRLNNPELERKVLGVGETVLGKAKILGDPYNTIYWPIKDFDEKIIGVWFIGDSIAHQDEALNRAFLIVAVCSLGIALLLALLAFWAGEKIARPIRMVTDFAVKVASGTLAVPPEVKSKDEVELLAGALAAMVRTLRERIGEAENAGALANKQAEQAHDAKLEAESAAEEARKKRENMLSAALRLETSVNVLRETSSALGKRLGQARKGAEQQAEHVAASASGMTEMSSSAGNVAANAAHAGSFSSETREKATEGEKIVAQVLDSIKAVREDSLILKRDMAVLSKHTDAIGQVMGIISDIADQTNLLALNAAIEAARAGEAGRGFAVVADEVRKLAEKTMSSTGDVNTVVREIERSMVQSLSQADISAVNVDRAATLAQQSGVALREIVDMADGTAKQVEGIVTACEQQSAASADISRSITVVSTLADETVKIMEEAADDIASFLNQTDDLGNLVNALKTA